MDRLDAMEILVACIDEGSLAGAARRLGRSPASVTRAVTMLEDRLGERLLHRSTRSLRLTPVGERQVALYRGVLAALAAEEGGSEDGKTEEGRGGAGASLGGHIAITAPELFGRHALMPVVESFLAAHPNVRVRLLLLNRVVHLAEEGIDVALRLSHLPDSGLVAVRLGEMRRLICAAPAYLDRAGRPEVPADLRGKTCLGAEEGAEREIWPFGGRAGSRGVSVAVHPRIAGNSAGAAIDAAIRGVGICRAMAYQVAEGLSSGALVALLPDHEPPAVPVHLVFHPIPRRNLALRAFVDHAAPRLRAAIEATSRLLDR